ncbi:hypothetical protein E2C01_048764 [Portunus trituberculatus]|uniref:Uncharacterized protein n=1 Tax=Portunus trituberculatus TaxID=210409 RepID=A0A5B7GBY0_PORTR|nr:hypothetical protein [Portunus trituberculatus]
MTKEVIKNTVLEEQVNREILESATIDVITPMSAPRRTLTDTFPVEPDRSPPSQWEMEKRLECQLKMHEMELQAQREKEDKELQAQKENEDKEFQAQREDREFQFQLQKKEFEIRELNAQNDSRFRQEEIDLKRQLSAFNAATAAPLVLTFDESDVDSSFKAFEGIARCNKWPEDQWASLLVPKLIVNHDDSDLTLLDPFIHQGRMSLLGSENKAFPVNILSDTAAVCSVLYINAVPNLTTVYTGETIQLKGLEDCPIYCVAKVYLQSPLLSGVIKVAIKYDEPVPGDQLLLGNDVAGKLVVLNVTVVDSPLEKSPMETLDTTLPHLFPACAVTRSQSRHIKSPVPLPTDLPSEDLYAKQLLLSTAAATHDRT